MKNSQFSTLNPKLTLGWLYPELMSTYGDRGNIIVLQKRAQWRGIKVNIQRINHNSQLSTLNSVDLLFMGGAQDIQQEIVSKDLLSKKGETLAEMIDDGIPGLFICGGYQFLGNYYKDSYGNQMKGLGVFNMHTEAKPNSKRLIGNIIVKPKQLFTIHQSLITNHYLTGFENHGGRTYLGDKSQAFSEVISGFGNNGKDRTEGIIYKNSIGTYLHGPILPANPELADFILKRAFEKKYGKKLSAGKIDDNYSKKAKLNILRRLKNSY